jgi:alpha-ketoglutarate-dependent taurine dioxygenase
MRNLKMNSSFRVIDSPNRDILKTIELSEIKRHKAVFFKNLPELSEDEFVTFSKRFGVALPYGGGPILSFSGEAIDEDELHYDGISSRTINKVPDWLLFYVKKAGPVECGGAFKVSDAELALKYVPKDLKQFLLKHKLEFYGYYPEQVSSGRFDQFSFSVDPISTYKGRERLRIYLPSLGKRVIPDAKKVFTNTSVEESNAILKLLRDALYKDDVISRFSLQTNDLFILDNNFTFHGREAFSRKVERTLNRIQIIPGELPLD